MTEDIPRERLVRTLKTDYAMFVRMLYSTVGPNMPNQEVLRRYIINLALTRGCTIQEIHEILSIDID